MSVAEVNSRWRVVGLLTNWGAPVWFLQDRQTHRQWNISRQLVNDHSKLECYMKQLEQM